MPKKKVTEAVEETAQETIPVEKAPAQMPRRQGSEDLLELNDLERGVTREDSEEAKWGYLAGAVRRQQILTGIVSAGMTYTENGMPIVPIDFEGLCVKIPVREMTLIEWPEDEPIPRSVRVQIGRMLGATIDFIPAGVDFKERVAIGSRKAAMLQRQKRYYASGRVKPGILMACRVLTVGNNTMMVEACGVDTEIYARNVSWEWFSDIADLHSTGDLVVARVLDVTYNEQRDTYAVNLSIKDASENPDRAALEKIVPNSNYFGVVTGVKDRVFFVRLQAGVNAKTKLYRSIDMPSRLDTVSFRVTRVDEENGIALGFITRIIKRHTRLRYSHTRPDGRRSNTVTDSRRTGENIHCITELYLEQQHKTLSDAVVNLWSNSKGHADNMLNVRYGEIGVGLARGTDSNGLASWYCVQVFLVDGCEVTWVDVPAIG